MYTPEMLASIAKVEATRKARMGVEPRRMTAEEKEALLSQYHPDYKNDGFATLSVGTLSPLLGPICKSTNSAPSL